MQGTYNIPAIYYKGHAVLTNTAPTAVYRSAGRPEAIYMIERLIDLAAEQHAFDKVDLRRRNLIQSDDMPFTNGVGVTYDSGGYTAAMDAALHEEPIGTALKPVKRNRLRAVFAAGAVSPTTSK